MALTTLSPQIASLSISQASPTTGLFQRVFGTVSGTFSYNPTSTTLVWKPAAQAITIGDVTYHLVTDGNGEVVIEAPTAAEAGQNHFTPVRAFVTVSPEPGTMLLLAPGLAGFCVAVVRSRRRARFK